MSIKILHTGDWHLGQFNGPVSKDGGNVRFQDICKCLDYLVFEADKEGPDFILITGDLFHNAKVWADRGLLETNTAIQYIRRLKKIAPVAVLLGTPNHDGLRQFEALRVAFESDQEVEIVTEPKVIDLYNGVTDAEVQIACMPGFDRGFFRARRPGLSKEEENEVFANELHNIILGLRAQCRSDVPCILMGHYTVVGADMESGQTALFGRFEPVIYPATLRTANFDLNCFGHIHRPQKVSVAKNVFYCGAVSALNFNDEAQMRGFYVHEIDDSRKVVSRFLKLPSREFQTIRLEDEDVMAFLENPMPRLDKELSALVRDKVVRVIYNCTDEHHKIFSPAMYEKLLYTNGAFFVQEVTPQKILVTADRNSMERERLPEEHLAEYLSEKGYKKERIAELVELAKPVINQVMEQVTRQHNTGTLLPVSIEVKNYRHYKRESFSFENISFCVINGQNGVGKSSLFMDSIVDCLFEQTREGELTGWISNDPSVKSGSIMFTFRIGKHIYRVTRTRCKSGKATLNLAEQVDGVWQDRSKERIKDTQAEIEKVLEMDAMTLKSCALIMQNQYGVFMEASSEDRMNILANMLGLKPYELMMDIFADKLTEFNRELKLKQGMMVEKTTKLKACDLEGINEDIACTLQWIDDTRKSLDISKLTAESLRIKVRKKEQAGEQIMKLKERCAAVSAKHAAKSLAAREQQQILSEAEILLAQEKEIRDGVALYQQLLDREKKLIAGKASHDEIQRQFKLAREEKAASAARKVKLEEQLSKEKEYLAGLNKELSEEDYLGSQHEKYAAVDRKLSQLNSFLPRYRETTRQLEEARAIRDQVIHGQNERINSQKAIIKSLEDKVKLLKESDCPVSDMATCKFLQDALAAKEKLPEADAILQKMIHDEEREVKKAEDNVLSASLALGKIPYSLEAVERLSSEREAYLEDERRYQMLDPLKAEKQAVVGNIAALSDRISDEKSSDEKADERISALTGKLHDLSFDQEAYEKLQDEITAAKVWIEKEKELAVAKTKKDAAMKRKEEIDFECGELQQEMSDLLSDLKKELSNEEGIEDVRTQLKEADKQVHVMTENLQKYAEELGALRRKKDEANGIRIEISGIKKSIERLGEIVQNYEVLKKAFSQDGIPHSIVRSVLPVMEAKATSILGQMSGGRMSIEFITEKVLKSNSKKEVTTLDIIINDVNKGRLPYLSKSGGEKVKSSLAVILALAELKKSQMGVQTGFLFIDEAAFLDSAGVQAYCDALVAIQERYPDLKIMAITHDETFKARFPQSIDIIDSEEGSKVA